MARPKPITRREFIHTTGAGFAGLVTAPHLLWDRPAGRASTSPGASIFHFDRPSTPRIVVIGVGSAGGSILDRLSSHRPARLRSIAIHTDARELDRVTADRKLPIGIDVTRSFGCGGSPDRGRRAVEEHRADVEELLRDADPDLVFVVGGMGGGTFTGAAPVITRFAREAGALTLAVVTRPFTFEGRVRNRQAAAGLPELAANTDTVIAIPNDRVLEITGTKVRFVDALRRGTDAAASAVRAITGMLTVPGLVNVGFADLRAVLEDRGLGAVGIGEARGDDRAVLAACRALSCPLLRDADLGRATGVLIQIVGDDLRIDEFEKVSELVYAALADDVVAICGDTPDPDIAGGVRVTVVAIGSVAPWSVLDHRGLSAGDSRFRSIRCNDDAR